MANPKWTNTGWPADKDLASPLSFLSPACLNGTCFFCPRVVLASSFFYSRRLASVESWVNNSSFSPCGTKRVHHHLQWFCRYFVELSVMTESVIGLFLQTYWFDWIFGGFIFYLCGASGTLGSAVVFQHLCGHFEVHFSVQEALISHGMWDLVYI